MSWNWLTLGDDRFLVFRYVDPQAGPSAKGAKVAPGTPDAEVATIVDSPRSTFRLPMGQIVGLTSGEIERFGLPNEPAWMEHFRPQQKPWHDDPRLEGAFHPDYPDDLQALFHLPDVRRVESMWVRLAAIDTEVDGYVGVLLNSAHGSESLTAGTRVTIRPAPGVSQPVWVSHATRDNLSRYRGACEDCGFDLLLMPVDELIARTFPDAPTDAALQHFTTRCAICAGTQALSAV